MNEYLERWLNVIDGMRNVNTYKLAWGRAIVELCHEYPITDHPLILHFDQISERFLKYYWNQTYFFKLYQGPAKTKPIIQQTTEALIKVYQEITKSTLPVWFDQALPVLKKDMKYYQEQLKSISKAMSHDVAWRFSVIEGSDIDLYDLDLGLQTVTLNSDRHAIVKDHAFVLSQLMNYRWAQLLEKFNQAPRIASKVKGFSDEKIRRKSLSKFKEALLQQFPDGVVKDFYTDEILDPNDISIDHVIPWSFMYSDDIWNLVITSKSRNSSKSNLKVTEMFIEKLKGRNKLLESVLEDSHKEALKEAEESKLIDRFYYQFII